MRSCVSDVSVAFDDSDLFIRLLPSFRSVIWVFQYLEGQGRGIIVEHGPPKTFFTDAKDPRTKEFLSQIL